ncbi:phosphonate ABC transporter, permease protein [Oleispira antarctica RB-8]|uniref:Phosphonate ABC transporter, permease protein n=1 Tax=Oleispira antarctica RB-8 TaxID=698738 RepID=R4YT71_OLEAN|nr:phosphonate ABC transporter, permease protein [Oleispira antarctica RB-8]
MNSSRNLSLAFLIVALLCIPFADLVVYQVEPWDELARIGQGIVQPSFPELSILANSLIITVAFALIAVSGAAFLGLLLALVFHSRIVRVFSASIRAVHELFWGLIFMQIYGLSATTGVLAILVPFTGIFAKMFAEIIEQQSRVPHSALSTKTDRLSQYFYTWLPQSWPQMVSYTRYRFECALRSSTILGFIGLPTLGFYLETAFKQGQYNEAAGLLFSFFILIATIRWWFFTKIISAYVLIPIYLLLAFIALPDSPTVYGSSLVQFLTQDIWPKSLLNGDVTAATAWYQHQLFDVALPALWDTLLLSQLALVLTGLLVLLFYPWASKAFFPTSFSLIRGFSRTTLLVLRSVPEMIFAFVFLLILGPSGIPAVLALALHNAGLISYLLVRHSEQIKYRADVGRGINHYFYEVTPRIYPHFLSLLLYRWEVIIRESAILGILGITTLGFYIDSAFEDIRYDRALFLILISALLNIAVDSFSRRVRGGLSQ